MMRGRATPPDGSRALMQRSPWLRRGLALLGLLLLGLLLLSGCPGQQQQREDSGTSDEDSFQCKWPPTIEACDAPPNAFSQDLFYCWGCTCAGATSAAACNPDMQDCRLFFNGCYPQTYKTCDQNQQDTRVLAMCQYCFLSDAGGLERCDKYGSSAGADGAAPAPAGEN